MLVSAIMPTRGRPDWVLRAVECFRAQTWPEKELVIVDDWDAPSFRVPPVPRYPNHRDIDYHRVNQRMTIGAKRNVACSRAAGEVICHWDDDDWSAPERMEDQVGRLIASGASITGYHSMLFRRQDGTTWLYKGASCYALGTSLCYTREFWREHRFADKNVGEDNDIVMSSRDLVSVDAKGMMLATIHPGNTSKRAGLGEADCWERVACA